jgi:hypothetical protein
MNDTALDHPLIRAYLQEVAEALGSLPSQRAAELRDQIAAHLDDELPPGASDEEVAKAIRRMGAPGDLAREAGARPRQTFRAVLRRRSRKFWAISASAALIMAAAGVPIGLLVSAETAPALTVTDGGWWYSQDYQHEFITLLGDQLGSGVPVRWGQQQGLVFQIWNTSGYTQTVLGYAPGSAESPGNAQRAQLGVSLTQAWHYPATPDTVRYALPVSIPPHDGRALRVLWTQENCLQVGASQSIDELELRVRVGSITKTETIMLGKWWAVQAKSACQFQ